MITNFSIIETTISNSCFLILLLITIYYWGKIIFFSNTNTLLKVKLFSSLILSNPEETLILETQKKSTLRKTEFNFGFLGFAIVALLLTIQLLGRWIESGHFPLSGLYESLLFLTWGIIFFYLFIEFRIQTEFLGTLIAPIILCILTFTGFSLPIELQQNKPLVPALQSNWLFMHVSVMMLSYSALILGCLMSIFYLAIFFFRKKFKNSKANTETNSSNFSKLDKSLPDYREIIPLSNSPMFESNETTIAFQQSNNTNLGAERNTEGYFNFNNLQELLSLFENLSYRLIGIGFCFLTLGILSGAVWANETWGSYWSWDPKETWALITWLTFAIYLHTRILKGWTGVKSASIASFGFFVIWFCYLGVNLLGKGLHSYGFFN